MADKPVFKMLACVAVAIVLMSPARCGNSASGGSRSGGPAHSMGMDPDDYFLESILGFGNPGRGNQGRGNQGRGQGGGPFSGTSFSSGSSSGGSFSKSDRYICFRQL